MSPKVGIIMVTYNRADVTCLALDALATTPQTVPTKIFLIDNKSQSREFLRIKESAEYLKSKKWLDLELISSPKNLGFAGGNNIGLEKAFADESITHICLLNNDTIVTPYWLDRLLAHNSTGLLGPITNSVGNEQVVPTPSWARTANGYLKQSVWEFSETWYMDHIGQRLNTHMLGFFCVFGKKAVFEQIGLLDTKFGVGTFEDDDYCFRAHKLALPLEIARDVFIYHWGSASFSALKSRTFLKLILRNKKTFEEKHKTKWENPISTIHKAYRAELENLFQNKISEPSRLRIQQHLARYESMQKVHIESLYWPHNPFNPKRRIDALKLAISNKYLRASIVLVSNLIRYFIRPEFRKKVNLHFSSVRQLLLRTLRKKKGILLQFCRPGRNNLICLPICAYSGRKQRPQQIIDRLLHRFDKVFWLTPFGSRVPGIIKIKNNLYEVFLRGQVFNFYTDQPPEGSEEEVDALNLSRLIPRHGRTTIIVQAPYWNTHIRILKKIAKDKKTDVRVVYDCMDLHSGFGTALKINGLHEDNIIHSSDVIVASSDVIESNLRKYNKPLEQIKNGCSPQDFPLMTHVPQNKKVGYFGAIAEWFDFKTVIEAAKLLPDYSFELIGDYSTVKDKVEHWPSNIVLIGEKPFYELKDYAKDWNVALIPFLITPLIEATNPVKLYEYLSLGLPIVSSPIPEVMASGADVLIAQSGQEMASAILSSVKSDSSEKRQIRRQFAEKHDWSKRAELFANLIFNDGSKML